MEGSSNTKEISLGDGFGEVAVKVNGTRIEVHTDGSIDVYPPSSVRVHPAANDGLLVPPIASEVSPPPAPRETGPRDGSCSDVSRLLPAKAAHEIGAIESTGEHKGEIYGGIYPADNKPIWFSAAPKVMDHYKAAAWAEGQGGSLPTRKQGDYLTTLKGQGGAFTEIFNRGGSFPAGYVWLAEPVTDVRYDAWCQRLSDGDQARQLWISELPVLSVRR